MISLYSGTPRSGKSLHAADKIIWRSRLGRPVIANFTCNLAKYKKAQFTYCPNADLTPEYLIEYAQQYFQGKPIREGEILLVIDEAQLMFNSLDTRRRGRHDWLRFFTLHGKLGYDIILIAQNDRMIDRQVRGLIEYEYIHRKLSNFGIRGLLLRCVTFGAGFVVVQRWYPIKQHIGQEFFRCRKSVYSIYDSYVLFDATDTLKSEVPAETAPELPDQEQNDTQRPKEPILLRLFSRCLKWFPKRKALPRRGRYLRDSKQNQLGWKTTSEEVQENNDVHGLQVV